MQFTAAAIHAGLHAAGETDWSLEDVCCYVPVWFGMSATLFTGLLAHEGSGGSAAAAAGGAAVMAVLPAHLSRSVGGGFDNESVAITALCATFYFWCRALRSPRSWPAAVAAAATYAFMAAAWGGYVFVINMVWDGMAVSVAHMPWDVRRASCVASHVPRVPHMLHTLLIRVVHILASRTVRRASVRRASCVMRLMAPYAPLCILQPASHIQRTVHVFGRWARMHCCYCCCRLVLSHSGGGTHQSTWPPSLGPTRPSIYWAPQVPS